METDKITKELSIDSKGKKDQKLPMVLHADNLTKKEQ